MIRRILIVSNPYREETQVAAEVARRAMEGRGIEACAESAEFVDAVLVLGGDGTMLRAARAAQPYGAPVLGVNLGHVGFLAEFEREDIEHAVERLASGAFEVEERSTVDVVIRHPDGSVERDWAFNEATIERSELQRTLDVAIEVDGRPLTAFGCDGVVISSPTGSTAHAFSAGGPVMWPDVEALLMVPLAAHALFARPLVLGPKSRIALEVTETSSTSATVVLDGAISISLEVGGRVEFALSHHKVRLARMSEAPFTDRLVRKFGLSTEGWRGAAALAKE